MSRPGSALALASATALAAGAASVIAASPASAADGPCSRTDNTFFICKSYPRGAGKVNLRYGIEFHQSGGWGYEHIKATHGWSSTYDSYIRLTIATGHPDVNPTNKKTYYTANPGNEPGCKFTVVDNTVKISWEPAAREIESAYGNGFCATD